MPSPSRSSVEDENVAMRATVNLTPRSTEAMKTVMDLTGDTKTEAVNKALQAYALIQEAQEKGGGAWLQNDSQSDPVLTRFL